MSAEDVELVRSLSDAFQRRDHEAVFGLYDTDIEWDSSRLQAVMPDAADVYRGHEGVRTYWRRWLSAWKDLQYTVEDVREVGGNVILFIRDQRQWGRHTGIETIFSDPAMVFTIADGKVVRCRLCPDHATALEVAAQG